MSGAEEVTPTRGYNVLLRCAVRGEGEMAQVVWGCKPGREGKGKGVEN